MVFCALSEVLSTLLFRYTEGFEGDLVILLMMSALLFFREKEWRNFQGERQIFAA